MIIQRGVITGDREPTYVQIKDGDSYFWSEGCQPWIRVDRK